MEKATQGLIVIVLFIFSVAVLTYKIGYNNGKLEFYETIQGYPGFKK